MVWAAQEKRNEVVTRISTVTWRWRRRRRRRRRTAEGFLSDPTP
jgi:hypothetical protein